MSSSQRPRLAELKVGIFVIITCTILAAAIFAIGSQVGLFQEKFWALTYLNNVSGLKPGDIVLLNGVEAGNVMEVAIGEPGQILDTVPNQRIRRELEQIEITSQENRNFAETAALKVSELDKKLQALLRKEDYSPAERVRLEADLQSAKARFSSWDELIVRDERMIERAYSRLQNIEVHMRINAEYRGWVSADSRISLGSIGMLGDKYIEISLGRTSALSQIVQHREKHWWGTKTRDLVLIAGTPQASFGEIITGANDVLANVETLSAQLDKMMSSFNSEQGTIGKFINDPSVYENLDAASSQFTITVNEISDFFSRIEKGEGTISSLIKDEEMYSNLNSSIDSLEKLLAELKEGDGTFARFVKDPSVFEKTEQMLTKVNLIADDMRAGKGTIGMLATDDELYISAKDTFLKLDKLLGEIEQGHGTLGQLVQSDELYDNLNILASELVKFMYDFRQDPKRFLTIKFELF
jgi:phospholipid/cholesterol/gamma-HCH transport system substrate-binding protein